MKICYMDICEKYGRMLMVFFGILDLEVIYG